jgi:predicted dehydrogenase
MAAKLNWGILTTGLIAGKFAADLRQSRTGRLVAVGARRLADAKKFAADFGASRAHGSYAALLADPAVEAVYIATPHPWHAEWAIRAAEAGKHILCEKPLTLRRADTERVIAAARAHHVLLMEAFMYRLHPQTRKIVELVGRGAIGELRLIRASFNVVCPFDPEHRMFKQALGGGAILDLGCYPVSFSRHIAGAARGRTFADPVAFKGLGRVHPQCGTDEFATAVVRYPGGIIAELSCGSTIRRDHSAQIHGTAGWIDVPNPFTPGLQGQTETITVHRRDGADPQTIAIPSPGLGLYAYEADAVAAALARGEHEVPEVPWADSLGIARMLDAWLEAVGVDYPGL